MELKKEKTKSFWMGLFSGGMVVALLMTVLSCGIIISQAVYYKSTVKNFTNGSSLTASSDSIINRDVIEKSEELENYIDSKFLFEDDIDKEATREMIYAAIMDSLGDKYTVYYTKEELADMLEESEGVYYGIGSYVQIDEKTSLPMLSQIFPDSPAEKAGLRNGDLVFAADGVELTGYTLSNAVALIKGPQYTDVNLTVLRNGEYIEFTVTRDKCESPTVSYEMKEDSIGYIKITEFEEITYTQFVTAYEDLQNQGMKALVIDLRSNPGGNLNTVVDICGEILPKGVITYTLDKNGKRQDYNGQGKNVIDIPMAVLVNENSASASELMTGAIRDYGKGVIIGTNTFGKGIVQSIYPLSDGSGIKITTSRYYTPNGECIHGIGIAPDIEIEFDSDLYYSDKAIDNQLEKAIDYLKKQ